MSSRSILLIGGPDSGKTNYIGRLWHALKARKGALQVAELPSDITFVEETLEHMFAGHFAPRSEHTERRRDFVVAVKDAGGATTDIVIPDVSGELWRKAVLTSEIPAEWIGELGRADGAILFVRVLSNQNERPLDWVTSRGLLSRGLLRTLSQNKPKSDLPTQVMLCELIRFLELSLAARAGGGRPRLSVVVAAWDLLDDETAARGPEAFLTSEFPLAAGRLSDLTRLESRVFGLSVVGGDIGTDQNYRNEFLERPFEESGWIVEKNARSGLWEKVFDVTIPVAWAIGV